MQKILIFLLCIITGFSSRADDLVDNDGMPELYSAYGAVQQFCIGISDRISQVSGVAKTNTVLSAVGTVASGGALAVGIAKSQIDKRIEDLQNQICERGGCDADKVDAMSNEEFFHNVLHPFTLVLQADAELAQMKADKSEAESQSKKLGNWRSGLIAGGVGANVATAIIAGLNKNQSDLIQQISACNTAVMKLRDARFRAINDGINPLKNPVLNELNDTIQACGTISPSDVEKVEKRMGVVMGTGIGGAVVGLVGTGTSIAANTDSVRNDDAESGKQKEKTLNIMANVSAGIATATGAVGTGFNISLISLAKKLIQQSEQCEETLQ